MLEDLHWWRTKLGLVQGGGFTSNTDHRQHVGTVCLKFKLDNLIADNLDQWPADRSIHVENDNAIVVIA